MKLNLGDMTTEQRNEKTRHIDNCGVIEMLEIINDEDALVHAAVRKEIPNIAKAVEAVVDRFKRGGRLFYIGAGTSGRLGILDASECPPTYGTDTEMVQGIIAGGYPAIFKAVEGAEDSEEQGREAIIEKGIAERDVVVGITASGRTPYVLGAVRQAGLLGAVTIGLSNNRGSDLEKEVEIAIIPLVGPEVITGSTRMKAGTSQKLVLNMLTTGAMIRLGKVYDNLTVDVKSSNEKLVDRCERIVMTASEVDREKARQVLSEAAYNPKKAIIRLKTGACLEKIEEALAEAEGRVARAVELINKEMEEKDSGG